MINIQIKLIYFMRKEKSKVPPALDAMVPVVTFELLRLVAVLILVICVCCVDLFVVT